MQRFVMADVEIIYEPAGADSFKYLSSLRRCGIYLGLEAA